MLTFISRFYFFASMCFVGGTTISLLGCQARRLPLQGIPGSTSAQTYNPETQVVTKPASNDRVENSPAGVNRVDIEKVRTCADLSSLDKYLSGDELLNYTQKKARIDSLIVPIRKNLCQQLENYLLEHYKDQEISDFIVRRLQQLRNFQPKDIVDIIESNPEAPFDAGDLWLLANDPPYIEKSKPDKDHITVSGAIVASAVSDSQKTRSIYLNSVFAAKDIKKDTLSREDVSKMTSGQIIHFSGLPKNTDDQKHQVIAQSQSQFDDLNTVSNRSAEMYMKIHAGKVAEIQKQQTQPKKYNFSMDDAASIDECGNNPKVPDDDTTLMVLKKYFSINGQEIKTDNIRFEQDHKRQTPSHMSKTELVRAGASFDKVPPFQEMMIPAFWNLSKTCQPTAFVTTEKTSNPLIGEPKLIIRLHVFPIQDSKHVLAMDSKKGAAFYTDLDKKGVQNWERKDLTYEFILGGSAAYWLRHRTESVARCLEGKQIAASNASRVSLRTYALLSFLKGELEKHNVCLK